MSLLFFIAYLPSFPIPYSLLSILISFLLISFIHLLHLWIESTSLDCVPVKIRKWSHYFFLTYCPGRWHKELMPKPGRVNTWTNSIIIQSRWQRQMTSKTAGRGQYSIQSKDLHSRTPKMHKPADWCFPNINWFSVCPALSMGLQTHFSILYISSQLGVSR